MKNFTKAFLVSLLMSGSFMVNAADWNEQELAQRLAGMGLNLQELREDGVTDESLWEMVSFNDSEPAQHQAPQHVELQFSEEDANALIAATLYTENLLKIERKDQQFAEELEGLDKSFAIAEKLERENGSDQRDHLLIPENDDEALAIAVAGNLEGEASDDEDLHAARLAAEELDAQLAKEIAAELEKEEKAARQRIANADEELAKQIAATFNKKTTNK